MTNDEATAIARAYTPVSHPSSYWGCYKCGGRIPWGTEVSAKPWPKAGENRYFHGSCVPKEVK